MLIQILFFESCKYCGNILLIASAKIPRGGEHLARGASCHPAFMGNCQTISHTPHSPTYPVDEGSEV